MSFSPTSQLTMRFENPISKSMSKLAIKEPNYSVFRKIISNHTGSPVLKLIKDNADALDLDPDVFSLVYEGFWDLYTLKPQIGVSPKTIQQEWIKKINIRASDSKIPDEPAVSEKEEKPEEEQKSQEGEAAEEAKEESKEPVDVEDIIEPFNAIVRVKIPKVIDEPEKDEEGKDIIV